MPDALIGVHHCGASAPGPVLMAHFGFSVEHVVATTTAVLRR
jgi:transketolase